ncbi:hypothetical protein C2W62_35385 [Candidatus Entotheonella serta]|nr:hypothetical protein C2W62_35385 [Candidatus Entotheonella serta]
MMQNILNNLDFLTEEEYEKLSKELKKLEESIRKTLNRYKKELRKRENQDRGLYGLKTGLLEESAHQARSDNNNNDFN